MFRVHKWETFPKLGDGLQLLPCPRPLIVGLSPTPGGSGGGGEGGGGHALPCTRFEQQLEKIKIHDIKIVKHKGPNTHVIIHVKAPIGGKAQRNRG